MAGPPLTLGQNRRRPSIRFTGVLLAVTVLTLSLAFRAEAQMSSVQTVFIIVMENKNWSQIRSNPSAPYINDTLLPMAAYAEQYFTPPGIHPSLPNYLWLEAGTSFGILNDGSPAQNHQSTTDHLVTHLNAAGISWKTYQEDIDPTRCPLTDRYPYATKHNPFVYFDDVTNTNDPGSQYCIDHVRPYTELKADLAANVVAQYNFITPNLCNDMHDSCAPLRDPVLEGDTWLASEVPTIVDSEAYQRGGALFIVWDEGGSGSDGPIPLILLSPFGQGGGYSNSIPYTHGSLLRTVQEIFKVPPWLGNAEEETDLSDLFAPEP